MILFGPIGVTIDLGLELALKLAAWVDHQNKCSLSLTREYQSSDACRSRWRKRKVPEHERDRSQKRAGVGAPPLAADCPLLCFQVRISGDTI